jgi:hypothetical protein
LTSEKSFSAKVNQNLNKPVVEAADEAVIKEAIEEVDFKAAEAVDEAGMVADTKDINSKVATVDTNREVINNRVVTADNSNNRNKVTVNRKVVTEVHLSKADSKADEADTNNNKVVTNNNSLNKADTNSNHHKADSSAASTKKIYF